MLMVNLERIDGGWRNGERTLGEKLLTSKGIVMVGNKNWWFFNKQAY
jgi:hypothetical protein